MTHEEKIEYMRIAVGIAGFAIHHKDLDLLVSVYELVLKKKGKGNIEDVLKTQREVKDRADTKSKQELLDKISDKEA